MIALLNLNTKLIRNPRHSQPFEERHKHRQKGNSVTFTQEGGGKGHSSWGLKVQWTMWHFLFCVSFYLLLIQARGKIVVFLFLHGGIICPWVMQVFVNYMSVLILFAGVLQILTKLLYCNCMQQTQQPSQLQTRGAFKNFKTDKISLCIPM